MAYKITANGIGPSRERIWQSDPKLNPRFTLEPDDYFGAYKTLSTDRGHLAPLAAFSSFASWEELQFLSNVAPMKADLNRGPWMRLEGRVRDMAKKTDVWVVTGPLYERPMPRLPGANEKHRVPSGYFKVIIVPSRDRTPSVAAFVFDQFVSRDADECRFQVTVAEVQRRSVYRRGVPSERKYRHQLRRRSHRPQR